MAPSTKALLWLGVAVMGFASPVLAADGFKAAKHFRKFFRAPIVDRLVYRWGKTIDSLPNNLSRST